MPTEAFTFEQLRDAVQGCTNFDLIKQIDDDNEEYYLLVDPHNERTPFYELVDLEGFIRSSSRVNEYLDNLR